LGGLTLLRQLKKFLEFEGVKKYRILKIKTFQNLGNGRTLEHLILLR